MFCPECGSQLEEGARFCQNCGAKVQAPDSVNDERKHEEPLRPETVVMDQPPKAEARPAASTEAEALSSSALTMGILSLVFSSLGLLGLIFAIIGKSKVKKFRNLTGAVSGKVTAGKILSTIGLIISIIMTVVWIIYTIFLISLLLSF